MWLQCQCWSADGSRGVQSVVLQLPHRQRSLSVLGFGPGVSLPLQWCETFTLFQGDKLFMFNFRLSVANEGREVSYALNKTCSPSLPWSPREVTCELNYMEVSWCSRCVGGAFTDVCLLRCP